MYERFTDLARKVMQLANQEAQRFNHEYIGTEHILLGLVKEGTGVAANVLKNRSIDLGRIRLEVEKIAQAGPDMVQMGKLPQTPAAKKVIEFAIEEARNFNDIYVGSEHILLGIIREDEGIGALVLKNLNLTLQGLREDILTLLGPKEEPRVDTPISVAARNQPAGFLLIPSAETVGALERLRIFSQRETLAETLAAVIQAFFWIDPLFTRLAMEVRELETLPEPPKPKEDAPIERRLM